MGEFSDYLETKILEHMIRNQAFSPPTAVYLALFTTNTGLESNAPSSEVSGNAYARQTITFNQAAAGSMTNNGAITFPTATPATWGTITSVAVVDHVSNTNWGTNVNVLMWTDITPVVISANDIFQINDTQLTLSAD